ncbi:MAG: hypothetical protein QM541_15415 [Flavobacterium sp.]|nr:hypothetical protein [Flavobacterium sp.]
MKLLLLLLFTTIYIQTNAQQGFVVLRKRNQTIQTFFPTSYIRLQLSNMQWIEGRIKLIKEDSLFIDLMAIRQVANYFGLPTVDTLRFGMFKIHLNEIYALPKTYDRLAFITNGTVLQIGSAGYMGLNIINGIGKNDPIFSTNNGTRLGIAAGIFAIGTLLHRTHKDTYILGKKYQLFSSNHVVAP